MPELKPIPGKTSSCARLVRYLLVDKETGRVRALARDSFNVSCDEPDGRDAAGAMDATRDLFRNGEARNGKSATTFYHYVISLDARDEADLPRFRDLVCTWVEEFYPDYQAVVAYHDDNGNHVLHAHVVVNNTNLRTGKRITYDLTPRFRARSNNALQTMALERGFRAFSADHESMTDGEMVAAGANVSTLGGDPNWRDHTAPEYGRRHKQGPEKDAARGSGPVNLGAPAAAPRRPRRRRDAAQHNPGGMDSRPGYVSWKTEIQDRVDVARAVARNEKEFLSSLRTMGIEVTRAKGGDYLYHHPLGGKKAVSGRRLGYAYERASVRRGFELNYVGWVQRKSRNAAAAPHNRSVLLTPGQVERLAREIHVTVPGSVSPKVDVSRVAALIAYNRKRGIDSLDGYGAKPMGEAKRMRDLAAEIGIFDADAVAREQRRLASDIRLVGEWIREDRAAAGAGGASYGTGNAVGGDLARRQQSPSQGREVGSQVHQQTKGR